MTNGSRLDLARSRDEAAFAELVSPHRRELHVHCYRLRGSGLLAITLRGDQIVGLTRFESHALRPFGLPVSCQTMTRREPHPPTHSQHGPPPDKGRLSW